MPKCEFDFVRFVEEWSKGLKIADRLLPVYEAVSNAIHAIQEKSGGVAKGRVEIELVVDVSSGLLDGFKVSDDGVGFTDENLDSFQRVFSTRKRTRGGKGVGRVSWLAFFKDVAIESVFQRGDGSYGRRNIVFSLQNEDPVVVSEEDAVGVSSTGSVVTMRGVRAQYGRLALKTADEIALEILKHFFLEITNGVQIAVKEKERAIDLSERREILSVETRRLKGETFVVTSANMRKTSKEDKHQVFYCADGRAVKKVDFETLCGVPSKAEFSDERGSYFVNAFVRSSYLDANVDANRTGFYFADGLLNDGSEPTREEVERLVGGAIRAAYREEFERIDAEKDRVVKEFVEDNPQYRRLCKLAKPELDALKRGATSKDVAFAFHCARTRLETEQRQTLDAFKKIDLAKEPIEKIAGKFRECLELIDATKQADLTAYVLKRKAVIELLEFLLNRDAQGAFHKERAIHELIYPMRSTSTDEESLNNNIWLIDDKLIPYEFIASDVQIQSLPGVESDSKSRPDLLAFNNPMAFAVGKKRDVELGEVSSIAVVEFKRPMRDDFDDSSNPIEQVLKYVRKLRKGYQNAKGRRVRLAENARVYCYIIADITESLENQCRFLHETQDGAGFFGTTPKDGAYVEVISYDKLLADAKKRNDEFFNRLSLPESLFIE